MKKIVASVAVFTALVLAGCGSSGHKASGPLDAPSLAKAAGCPKAQVSTNTGSPGFPPNVLTFNCQVGNSDGQAFVFTNSADQAQGTQAILDNNIAPVQYVSGQGWVILMEGDNDSKYFGPKLKHIGGTLTTVH